MFITDQPMAELSEPSIGAFNAPAFPSLPQRIGVVAVVRNHPFRLLPRTASRPGHADLGERSVRKRNFCGRGTFQQNTFTLSQYQPLRVLAALSFADCIALFFVGTKLPSRNASLISASPRNRAPPAMFARH